MSKPSPDAAPPSKVRGIILEALLVALVAALLAFIANALSPKGLKLTRNYSPTPQNLAPIANSASTPIAAPTNLAAQLQAEGLQLADFELVSNLFHGPGYQQGTVLFVDARNEQHYADGHIPGAYLLDFYHPESYLGTVLPLCLAAQQVIVYCNGGECEDSRFTAILLRDAQVPKEKLFVYAGGITEWANRAMPVELGERNSAHLKPDPKAAVRP
jgi:3-mercaptopyruvate sulfurtransferase SseA